MPSTGNFSEPLERLKKALDGAGAVVVGAGAGLSTAAGFEYGGRRFEKYFSDFAAKYGIRDMYSGGFYPFETPEEYWAWWSRHIWVNRYVDPPLPVYEKLLDLVGKKDYFVITTNVDHCFQKAGFDKERLFYTQGDYGLFQCSQPCRQETYDNADIIRRMVEEQENMRVPTELLPRCPRCGRPMTVNLRAHEHGKVLYWELGVGYNTPGIIKYPFWQMTAENPEATYACMNRSNAVAPKGIQPRSICIPGDIWANLSRL